MNDHKLIIMRHAKSDWSVNVSSDFDRPLTKRGIKAATTMGTWLESNKYVPDKIVCSPAIRAKKTSEIVCDQLGKSSTHTTWDERIYLADLDTLLNVIEDHAIDAKIMLIIGHNPGLELLLEHLSIDEPKLDQKGKLLTTAAVAILKYDKSVIKSDGNSANLEVLIRPKELAKS